MSIIVVNTEQSTSTVSGLTDKHVQQAAVDLSLENVWSMSGMFTIDEESKCMRKTTKIDVGDDGYYTLPEGTYEVNFNHDIAIGPDEAALIIPRSTLVRNGIQLTSGLWDPKFVGRGGCCMHVRGGGMRIKPGTRIGQFVVWKVLNAQGEYNGSYGLDADGTPKELETKYHC